MSNEKLSYGYDPYLQLWVVGEQTRQGTIKSKDYIKTFATSEEALGFIAANKMEPKYSKGTT